MHEQRLLNISTTETNRINWEIYRYINMVTRLQNIQE